MAVNLDIHEKFAPLYQSLRRFILLQGGAGSGKSYQLGQAVLFNKLLRPGNTVLGCRAVYRTIEDSIYQVQKDVIEQYGYGELFDFKRSPLSITNKVNGSKMLFRGVDQGAEKIKSIAGVSTIVFDEATELRDLEAFRMLNTRIRQRNQLNQFILAYNPTSKHHFLHDQFFVQDTYADHCEIIKTSWRDNPHLPDDYGEEIKRTFRGDPDGLRVYDLGEWGEGKKGLIYPDWKHVEDYPEDWPLTFAVGIDFGHEDPTAIVLVAIDEIRNDLYLQQLFYRSASTHKDRAFILDRVQTYLRKHRGYFHRVPMYADHSLEQIAELNNAGFKVDKAKKGPGSVVGGISVMKGFNNIYVVGVPPDLQDTTALERELKHYRWKEDNKKGISVPDDSYHNGIKFDHLLDASRYAVTSSLIDRFWTRD